MLSRRPEEVRTESFVAGCMLMRKVGGAHRSLLLLMLQALPRLHVLVKLRSNARNGGTGRSTVVPQVGVDVAGILSINDTSVGHHRELLR